MMEASVTTAWCSRFQNWLLYGQDDLDDLQPCFFLSGDAWRFRKPIGHCLGIRHQWRRVSGDDQPWSQCISEVRFCSICQVVGVVVALPDGLNLGWLLLDLPSGGKREEGERERTLWALHVRSVTFLPVFVFVFVFVFVCELSMLDRWLSFLPKDGDKHFYLRVYNYIINEDGQPMYLGSRTSVLYYNKTIPSWVW